MDSVPLHEAKTNLSRLIARVEAGEEIVLRRREKPVAKLVAYSEVRPRRRPGALEGQIELSPDFDEPLEDFRDYR